MVAPESNVVPLPGSHPDGLRWHLLELSNAARLAQEALAEANAATSLLKQSAHQCRSLAKAGCAGLQDVEFSTQAMLCRSLAHSLAAL